MGKNWDLKIEDLPHDFSLLINTDLNNHLDSYSVADFLHSKGVCISLHKPSHNLMEMLVKKGIDVSKMHFVDCISKIIDSSFKMEDASYIATPKNLREFHDAIENILKSTKGKKFMVLDSVQHLLYYHDTKTVLNFLNLLDKKCKIHKTNPVYIIDDKKLNNEIKKYLFNHCDKVINLKKKK